MKQSGNGRGPWRLLLALCWLAGGLALVAADPEKSVVQILNFSQAPLWDAPWRPDAVRRGSGTGFVVKGKRIMTNAHVVSWARQILVRRYQDPRPYQARVVFIGHDCDLALLEVEDPRFFEGLEPLAFGGLPAVRSTVVTYGYPAGGEQISYTRGVVSRIEMQTYVHIGNRSLLCVQTDAAINPGNSGGPVIQDGLAVGVAFQGIQGLENTGFFIPPPVVQHFLKDIEDGAYDGFPTAGIRTAPLQNPAFRQFLGLADNDRGVRVDSLLPIPATEQVLREKDVLLKVGEYEVGSDGTILYQGNRLHLAAALQEAQHGAVVPLTVWRDGKPMPVTLPVKVYEGDIAAGNQYDLQPKYLVFGGLVFTPLSLDYLKTLGRNWADAASAELVYELFYRRNETPAQARPEPVVLSSILAHPSNANFGIKGRAMVDKINGVRIEKMADLDRAFQAVKGRHHVFEFLPRGSFDCLDAEAATKAQAEVLQTYGLPKDRRL